MIELDPEVAAVWETILDAKNGWLADRILNFDLTCDNITTEFAKENKTIEDIAFCTILKNRVFHGGIIAKGAGMLKNGENGKGIKSRWYPKTLHDRIRSIDQVKHKINFITGDAFGVISQYIGTKEASFFIDPPYTVAGKRLYTHFDIDHEKLFGITAQLHGHFLLTYDDTAEIRKLAAKYGLNYRSVPMKTTHHLMKNEIIISDNFDWFL